MEPHAQTMTFSQIAAELHCHRSTLYRRLRPHRQALEATGWRLGDRILFPVTVTAIYELIPRRG